MYFFAVLGLHCWAGFHWLWWVGATLAVGTGLSLQWPLVAEHRLQGTGLQ